ncbi:tyrosine-type recombinase/integrase [Bradyrhizobium sp. RDM4]|uniref:tyrosine-type recombinase/integrase n=1 Tax=Bradyrhizobium sp. RDM4 TaxID=3378765 RepID=UPI0038FCC41A
MRGKITNESVAALIEAGKGTIADTNPTGFVARCQKSGKVSYFYRFRDKRSGKKHWIGLGVHGDITPKRARELAAAQAGKVAGRANPLLEQRAERAEAARAERTEQNTVNAVLDDFVKRHSSKLRSGDQVESAFDRYVRPAIGTMSIYAVRRRDVAKMLDSVADSAGPVMSDRVLAHIRKAFNWQAIRDDEFSSPIVRGMARTKPKERARKRTLADDEIRDIWAALETAPVPVCYPAFIKSLLLCMTRRNESARLHTSELDGGVWIIPGARYKNKLDHAIPLSAAARALVEAKPAGANGRAWFVFSTTGGAKPFSGFSKAKELLDAEIAKVRKAAGRPKMPQWQLHDLRRTGRSLMSRAGVDADHAERAMGHVIGGVRETYDRHEYLDEKRKAFEALAGLVNVILNPPANNVLPFVTANVST